MKQLDLIDSGAILKAGKGKPTYQEDRDLIGRWAESQGLELTVDTLRKYLDSLEGSANTYNRRVTACRDWIKTYFGKDLKPSQLWELESKLEEFYTHKKVQRVPVDGSRILSAEEIQTLIDNASDRVGLIIEMLYCTGLRVSELTGARVDRCRDDGGTTIRVTVEGKGKKERTVRIGRGLYSRILSTFESQRYLFETQKHEPMNRHYIGTQIRNLGFRTLGKRISPHMLRHSFASHKIADTGKIRGVADYLGHTNVSTTMDQYVHEALTDEELS